MNQFYRCEDFVADAYFRQWVKHPDDASTLYWNTYLAEHPEHIELIQQAAELVQKLAQATAALAEPVSSEEEESIWLAICNQIEPSDEPLSNPFLQIFRRNWLAIAASIALAIGLGWWLQFRKAGDKTTDYRQLAQNNPSLIEQTNDTDKLRLIPLPDGSSVFLGTGSQVTYARAFTGPNRVVYLTGEAYFEVTKDPSRPFLVYANGLLTKVLGTSFTVRAYADDKDVVVTVRSGRVAVYPQAQKADPERTDESAEKGIVLTRNQQLVFERQAARFIRPKTIVAIRPIFPKGLSPGLANFNFTATPVGAVFDELEKVYGVKIVYDKDTLGNCRLTADLTDASLSEKLTIICKSIEADYQMQQLTVVVTGPGCQTSH